MAVFADNQVVRRPADRRETTVLGESAGIPDWMLGIEANQPAKQQVVVGLLRWLFLVNHVRLALNQIAVGQASRPWDRACRN